MSAGENIIKSLPRREKSRRLLIRVAPTDQECSVSMPGRATQCMYATALRRMFPTALRAQVDMFGATVTDSGMYWKYNMTKKGANKLVKFDGREIRPGEDTAITLTLVEVRVISKPTAERQQQINEARRQRVAKGMPDKKYKKSLRLRVDHKKAS